MLQYLDGLDVISGVFRRGRWEYQSQKRRCSDGSKGQSDIARSQGMWADSRSGKKQGIGFPLESLEGMLPLILAP